MVIKDLVLELLEVKVVGLGVMMADIIWTIFGILEVVLVENQELEAKFIILTLKISLLLMEI